MGGTSMRICIVLIFSITFTSVSVAQQQTIEPNGWYVGVYGYSELGYFFPTDDLRDELFGFYNETGTFMGYGFEAGYHHGKSMFGLSVNVADNTEAEFEDDLYIYQRDYRSYTRLGFNFKRILLSTKKERLIYVQLVGDLGSGFHRYIAQEGTGKLYNEITRSYEYPRTKVVQGSFFSSAGVLILVGASLNSDTSILLNLTAVNSYFGTASYGFTTPKIGLMVMF
jgi:hypothetical protein